MCGILGQVNFQDRIDHVLFGSMLKTLSHRGPDGSACIFLGEGRIGLGHHRLSIIDLTKAGTQPMTNEDKTVWLVFNGEIYNFPALREQLIRSGHIFCSNADSEVIIHAYEEWGDECVKHLRGIFAFGIWDEKNRRLFLARDHFGVKPLYYWHDDNTFIFASQPRAIIANPQVNRKIDVAAFSDYLSYGYVPLNRAIYQGMAKLPAAHRLTLKDEQIKINRYWQLHYNPVIKNENEAVGLLRDALQKTVRVQMISDVPVGSFLSGGIDSSGITALMRAACSDTLQTFTIGFEEAESDERSFARIASKRFSTRHHEKVLTEDIARGMIQDFTDIYDEPFFDSSGLPTHFVSQLARENGLKVVMSGDGGDEVFAGYRWYDMFAGMMAGGLQDQCKRWIRYRWNKFIGQPVDNLCDEALRAYFSCVGLLPWESQQRLLTHSAKDEINPDRLWLLRSFYHPEYPTVTAAQYLDIHTYLADDILTKIDRASMACGLETRVPLLDHKLVELAFSIDAKILFRNRIRKYILKQALAEWVPAEILTARKKGFSIPIGEWQKNFLHKCALRALSNGSLVNQNIIKASAINDIASYKDPRILWLFLSAELWARRWVDGCSSAEIKHLFST